MTEKWTLNKFRDFLSTMQSFMNLFRLRNLIFLCPSLLFAARPFFTTFFFRDP